MPLANTLPELQAAEARLRADVLSRYGIRYTIREGPPNFAGLRTEADTTLLLRWRDQEVAAARKAAEDRRRAQGGTPTQIAEAGNVAADRASYRVSPFNVGFHPIGGAFDIFITDAGTSAPVVAARQAAEQKRRAQGGTALQVKTAGDVAAVDQAYKLVGSRAPAVGLRWGGTFTDNPATPIHEKPDPYHFELAQPRAIVAQKWAQYQQQLVQAAKNRAGKATVSSLVVVALVVGAGLLWAAAHGSS